MEPTNRRATGGSKPSALKRYGPLAAVVVVIAIAVIVFVAVGGSGDDTSTTSTTRGGTNAAGPVVINDANRDSIDWGSKCDVPRGRVAIPYTNAVPCVEPFKGDNGGATAQGVTADSIKIVVYQGDPAKNPLQIAQADSAGAQASDNASARATYRGYFDLFSKYYELYGRRIDLQFFDGTGGPSDEVAARNDARTIAEMKPFAVLSGANQTPAWSDELVANGMMCVGNCSLAVPQAFVEQHRPYVYGVGPTPEQAALLTAKMVTSLLAGRKAEFAGDALKGQTRKFGIVHYDTVDGQQQSAFAALKSTLAKGGVKIAADIPFLLDLAKAQENSRTMIAKLKAAGVTSVIFTGDPLMPKYLTIEATAQGYFPEWIIGSNVLVDIALFGRTYDQQQWQHAFGLALNAARGDQKAQESYNLYQWGNGTPPPNNTYGVIFADLVPLFTGLHMAGPDLTPQTFENGWFRYPVSGGTPTIPKVSRGHHGLWPGTDVGGTDDTGLIWWNPNAEGQDEVGKVGKGLYEYTAMGKRWTYNQMPTTDPGLFDPAKSVTIFTKVPDPPPTYPSPAK
jgi:hypothetical protein